MSSRESRITQTTPRLFDHLCYNRQHLHMNSIVSLFASNLYTVRRPLWRPPSGSCTSTASADTRTCTCCRHSRTPAAMNVRWMVNKGKKMMFHRQSRTHLSEVHGTPAVDLADASLVRAARGGAGGAKVALGRPAWYWRGVSVNRGRFSLSRPDITFEIVHFSPASDLHFI